MAPFQSDSDDLTAWLEQRDEVAFARIVERYSGLVEGICRRLLHRPDLIDEAGQALFLLVARKARDLAQRETIAGWVVVASRRICAHVQRAEARRHRHEKTAGTAAMPTPSHPIDPTVLDQLDRKLAQLPEGERSVITMRYLLGQGWDEIAQQLSLQRNTVEKRASRGLAKLRRWCGGERAFGTAGLTVALASLPGPASSATSWTVGAVTGEAAMVLGVGSASVGVVKLAIALSLVLGSVLLAAALALSAGFEEQSTNDPSGPDAVAPEPGPIPARGVEAWALGAFHGGGLSEAFRFHISADGRRVVTNDYSQLRCWDRTTDGELRLVQVAHLPHTHDAILSDDGELIAVLGYQQITILKWSDLSVVEKFQTRYNGVQMSGVTFLADAMELLIWRYNEMHVLDRSNGAMRRISNVPASMEAHYRQRGSKVDNEQPGSQEERQAWRELGEAFDYFGDGGFKVAIEGDQVVSIAVSPVGPPAPVVSSLLDGRVIKDLEVPAMSLRNGMEVVDLALTSDGSTVVVATRHRVERHGLVTTWDLESGEVLAQHVTAPPTGLVGVDNPDHVLVAVEDVDGAQVLVLALTDGSTREIHSAPSPLRLIPTGRNRPSIAAMSVGDLAVTMIDSEKESAADSITLAKPSSDWQSLAVSRSGRLAAANEDGSMVLWDLEAAQLLDVHRAPPLGDDTGYAWNHLAFAADWQSLVNLRVADRNSIGTSIEVLAWGPGFESPAPLARCLVPTVNDAETHTHFLFGAGVTEQVARVLVDTSIVRFDHRRMEQLPDIVWTPADAEKQTEEWAGGVGFLKRLGRPVGLDQASSDELMRASAQAFVQSSPDQAYEFITRWSGNEIDVIHQGTQVATWSGWVLRGCDPASRAVLLTANKRLAVVDLSNPASIPDQPQPLAGIELEQLWALKSDVYTATREPRLLPGGRVLALAGTDDIRLVAVASGEELARLQAWSEDDWLITTASGHWAGSTGAEALLIGNPDLISASHDQGKVAAFLKPYLEPVSSSNPPRDSDPMFPPRHQPPIELRLPAGLPGLDAIRRPQANDF